MIELRIIFFKKKEKEKEKERILIRTVSMQVSLEFYTH